MKKIILATLAAAALVACAKEDVVVAPKGEAIAFDNAFVDNTTKAIDPSITTKTLTSFVVYGTTQGDHADDAPIVRIFDGVEVTGAVTATDGEGKATAGSWNYAENYTQYWIDGNKYNFAAIKNGNVASYQNELPKTISYNAAGQTDLLYAEAKNIEGKKTGNGPVAFTFDHLLSKAVFTFKNTTPASPATAYTYKVTDIEISGVASEGIYDVVDGWGSFTIATNPLEFENIVALDTEGNVLNSGAAVAVGAQDTYKSHYERLLIPGTRDVTISCIITLYYGNAVVDVINYEKNITLTLVKGTAYSFNLEVGLNETIKFTVTKVEGWKDPVVAPDVLEPEHDRTPETNN